MRALLVSFLPNPRFKKPAPKEGVYAFSGQTMCRLAYAAQGRVPEKGYLAAISVSSSLRIRSSTSP